MSCLSMDITTTADEINVIARKITRIIIQLASELHISTKRAMLIFYNSTVGQQIHDPKYGYQIMSDTYIVEDIKAELGQRFV